MNQPILCSVFFFSTLLGYSCVAQPEPKEIDPQWTTLNEQAVTLYRTGKYQEALAVAKKAVEAAESDGDPKGLNVSHSLNRLGTIHFQLQQFDVARNCYEQALAIDRKRGEEDQFLATSLLNLGNIYAMKNDLAKSEELIGQSSKMMQESVGKDHPAMSLVYNGIASLMRAKGEYAKAEGSFARALEIREKALADNHPEASEIDVADSLNNLAEIRISLAKVRDAEKDLKRALAIYERIFAADHLKLVPTLINLGLSSSYQGRFAQAEKYYIRAINIAEQTMPKTLTLALCHNSLGHLYTKVDMDAQAKERFQKAYKIAVETLGKDDPQLWQIINNLADCCVREGQYLRAETLYREAIAVIRVAYRTDKHPQIAISTNNLADCYFRQDRFDQAEQHFKFALAIVEDKQVFGPEHPHTAATLASLAAVYRASNRSYKALPLEQRAARIRAIYR